MLEDKKKKQAKANEAKKRKELQEQKQSHTFRNTIKYFGKLAINRSDINSDSPIKYKIKDLRKQLDC
jgi:hypothetical protein